jgi:hypothetical protein
MSEITIFIIGSLIFAITVYGSVMAGGLALTRAEESALPLDVDEEPKGPVALISPSTADPIVGTEEATADPS